MPYLNDTELEMKERIMLIFHSLRNARTVDQARKEIEKLDKLIQSSRNGIEAGKKLWKNKDQTSSLPVPFVRRNSGLDQRQYSNILTDSSMNLMRILERQQRKK